MNYQSITQEQRKYMLDAVGVTCVEDLFVDVPREVLLTEPLPIDEGMGEIELATHLKALANKNMAAGDMVNFAGAGCYDHYQPSFIDHILRRPEFFTAYTPYQPEVSQGTLQAIYEYQTGICHLTGLDVANASMYDGATALVEAAFMAVRLAKKRTRVVVAGSLHPEWIETLETYAESGLIEVVIVEAECCTVATSALIEALDDTVAAVLMGYPNFYGVFEPIKPVIDAAHAVGALAVVAANPIILGAMTAPGTLGADVVVGEGQPLGNAMSFGGPGLGFFACKTSCIRQMPGRIVGKTTDVDGKDGYVLTLSTREQHIRREKATSNICSNHALNALAAGAYLAAVGPEGLRSIAVSCISKAHYLRKELLATGLFAGCECGPVGYEFSLRFLGDAEALHGHLFDIGYVAGIVLDDEFLLLAVTEKRTKEEIDAFVKEVVAYV